MCNKLPENAYPCAQKHILVRADATERIGAGHVMRCLAFAQAWKERGGNVTFVCTSIPETLRMRLQEEGFALVMLRDEPGTLSDAKFLAEYVSRTKAFAVLVDGYVFGSEYQRYLRETGVTCVVLDDYGHASHYYADIVINQNVYASHHFYSSREPSTKLFLGTRFVLLRSEFRQRTLNQRAFSEVGSQILVTLGGSDPHGYTETVVEAIQMLSVPNFEIIAVLGGCESDPARLARLTSDARIDVRYNVQNMASLMEWADFAITAAGSTIWELATLKLPALVIQTADNQLHTVQHLRRRGVIPVFAAGEEVSAERLHAVLSNIIENKRLRIQLSEEMGTLVGESGLDEIISELIKRGAADSRC